MEPLTFDHVTARARALSPQVLALLSAVAAEVAGDHSLLADVIGGYFRLGGNPSVLYEALLQTYLFAGFPAAIEALKVAHRCAAEQGLAMGPVAIEDYDVRRFIPRGEALFARVYGEQAGRVRDRMQELSPELDAWMIIEGYGKVLSRPGPITFVERELCAAVALAVAGWLPQLRSHLQALVREGILFDAICEALDVAALVASQEHIKSAYHVARAVWHGT